ncbi:GntR family transcriptional regulator [Salicibibacter kimchii]|uniref:GntR family transcriptional regulator n=1 Tax=Salicibibacter kimchii TaxID=2099786 RepID=A0A345C1R6_9BACI|nr:GntR family transcriptional regulator [Salicibibacter kimchii]AXF57147.1 GntR family transcriptional regulator [Salicibibacter kimchii]
MNQSFHDKKPIFEQIKEKIEDQILNDQLKENEQIPSTTKMVHFYKVNHLTASKGIQLLVDEKVIFKKRGVGMFVAPGAKEKLIQNRKELFADDYLTPMLQEAEKLRLSEKEIIAMIKKKKGDDFNES